MTEQNPNPVVVAVGHDPTGAALTYAAGEASRAGCGLHLLHVVHRVAQGPETVLVRSIDLEQVGRSALTAAAERAADLVAADVPITTELVRGGRVATAIVERVAVDARMVVLQRRSLSRLQRVVTRSVSSGVAAHALVPVVSVPADWSPRESGAEPPTVTVGVDAPERAEHVLRVAARAAAGRGARLRVLHTWSFPAAYDDLILDRTEEREWAARASAEVQAALDKIGDDLAGVDVDIVARHAYPSDALIEAGETSELLVIGRHDAVVPLGSHLGPVARAVLREATCPVLLADPRHAPRWFARHQRAEGAGA